MFVTAELCRGQQQNKCIPSHGCRTVLQELQRRRHNGGSGGQTGLAQQCVAATRTCHPPRFGVSQLRIRRLVLVLEFVLRRGYRYRGESQSGCGGWSIPLQALQHVLHRLFANDVP